MLRTSRLLPVLVGVLASGSALATEQATITASAGAGHTVLSDGTQAVSISGTATGFEYQHFLRTDLSAIVGYRQINDPSTQQSDYLGAYAGARYFPLNGSAPTPAGAAAAPTPAGPSAVSPYVDVAAALGHATYEKLSSAELGADTVSVVVGAGVMLRPFDRLTLDVGVGYEDLHSRGGNRDSLALTGHNTYVLAGCGYLMY